MRYAFRNVIATIEKNWNILLLVFEALNGHVLAYIYNLKQEINLFGILSFVHPI